jgi:uracil-DNA glycosylase
MEKKRQITSLANNNLGFSVLNAVEKLHEKLKKAGWSDILKTFVLSSEFTAILEELSVQVQNEKRFGPSLKEVFRAFELCPFDKLKAVIVGTEPFNQAGVPDGLAFSGKKMNPQTSEFYRCLDYGLYGKPSTDKHNPSLEYLANQGILLLNLSLTSTIDKRNRHVLLWQPFTVFLLDMLSIRRPDLVWIFNGLSPCLSSFLVENGLIFKAKHPEDWYEQQICTKTNKYLVGLGLEPIQWEVLQNTSTKTCSSSTSSLP